MSNSCRSLQSEKGELGKFRKDKLFDGSSLLLSDNSGTERNLLLCPAYVLPSEASGWLSAEQAGGGECLVQGDHKS